ncbi:MAG: alpha-glucosidase C-terminal domain-containing protein [Candidatus Cloacimonadota bacterium]|nr:alpha-glucosidase C-terminal domain-containing protein [Candidatus Cloacimonadota bacterium]
MYEISPLQPAASGRNDYVGTLHIWYGDEIGMMGAHDPDCRRPFDWKYTQDSEKIALRNYYQKLIDIRKKHKALSLGNFQTLITEGMVYGFMRSYENEDMIVVINNDTKKQTVTLKLDMADKVWKDLLSRRAYNLKNNKIKLEIPAMRGVILK